MPVVLYVVALCLTHSPRELTQKRVGHIVGSAWMLGLLLVVVTHLILNHAYESQSREAALLFALAVPAGVRADLRRRVRSVR